MLVCPALPCPALPCPALPCPALPCPAEVLLSPDLADEVGAEVECFSFEVGGKDTGGPTAFRARYMTLPPDGDFEASGL
eukprot:SAG22_NODE_398_length_11106_cov_67.829836_6_plen_79_part_00